jgi:hypothetical protein
MFALITACRSVSVSHRHTFIIENTVNFKFSYTKENTVNFEFSAHGVMKVSFSVMQQSLDSQVYKLLSF